MLGITSKLSKPYSTSLIYKNLQYGNYLRININEVFKTSYRLNHERFVKDNLYNFYTA